MHSSPFSSQGKEEKRQGRGQEKEGKEGRYSLASIRRTLTSPNLNPPTAEALCW